MTDLEKFIDTYKQFGIEVKTYENTDGNIEICLTVEKIISADKTTSDKFDGYASFFSILEFTKEGKFLGQAFLE